MTLVKFVTYLAFAMLFAGQVISASAGVVAPSAVGDVDVDITGNSSEGNVYQQTEEFVPRLSLVSSKHVARKQEPKETSKTSTASTVKPQITASFTITWTTVLNNNTASIVVGGNATTSASTTSSNTKFAVTVTGVSAGGTNHSASNAIGNGGTITDQPTSASTDMASTVTAVPSTSTESGGQKTVNGKLLAAIIGVSVALFLS